jgi:uncharacterized Zn-binding protein involved in type VI secretion
MRRLILLSPTARVLLTLAATIALTGCPGPDTNPPGSDGNPLPVENPDRMVSISGTMRLEDYESFGDNEHASGSFNKVVFVGNAQPSVLENVPPPTICAGDEIWAALDITVARVSAAGDVSVTVNGRLYEGTDCSNTDLDGSYSGTFTVPKGATMSKSFTMWNTSEDEPQDNAEVTLTVYNGNAP